MIPSKCLTTLPNKFDINGISVDPMSIFEFFNNHLVKIGQTITKNTQN